MEVEILTLRKVTTSVFTFSKNGRKTLYLVAGYRQKYYVKAACISTFFWGGFSLAWMDLLSIESLAFRQIKNTVYSWKVKMTGSNNETEEKGENYFVTWDKYITDCKPIRSLEMGIGDCCRNRLCRANFVFVFFRPGKPSLLQIVWNMTENGFEESGLIHHELRNGMYFITVSCAVKMSGILVLCT